MISLAPVVLTGNPQIVSLVGKAPESGQRDPIRLANESAYAIQVGIGGDVHWLNPWTADVFQPAQAVTRIMLTPSILIGPGSLPTSFLLVTLAEPGQLFGGIYPMALSRETLPLPWQNPTGGWVRFATSLGAGAVEVLVPGLDSLVVRLFVAVCSVDVAGTTNDQTLQDTNGNFLFDFGSTTQPVVVPGFGPPSAPGVGLQVFNSSTGAKTVRVGLAFSQA